MDMRLSKRGDYVMRSAISLARSYESGAPRKIREVVADTEVPRAFASQVLADLVRSGLALSRAGRDGGYWLTRPPSEISVLDVVEAAEGPLRPARCALGDGPCRWDAVCPLHESWSAATGRLAELLSSTSLAELAERDSALEAGHHVVPADAHRARPRSVRVADRVEVRLAPDAVWPALQQRADRLSPLVGAAWRDGAGAFVTTDPGRAPPPLLAECSLEPLAAGHAEPPQVLALAWRLSGPGGTSHFDGQLRVEAMAGGRAALVARGTWHQDADRDAPLTGAELDGLARAVLGGTLERLRHLLQTSSLRHATSR